ncbi:MAG: D-alanine--D-alanine ligase [Nitrospirota bacterium]
MTKGLVTKKRIGVLMGGLSSERDISMRSGLAIYQNLQEMGYNVVPIDVGKDVSNVLKKEKVKLAYLALHGGMGENGAMQGLLDVNGIQYTGSNVMASALAMDKETSKKIFSYHGLPVPPFIVVKKPAGGKKRSPAGKQSTKEVDASGAFTYPDFSNPPFDLPWVIKPDSEGSSIGVCIIKEEEKLAGCLEKTFAFGNRVIVEKFVKGKELHIGILGDRVLGGVEVRPSLEFYNYEAKYTSGLTDYIMPPEIDEAVYESAKEMALKAHKVLGCSGATRVDFMVDENNMLYILEVNTLPGMTTTSLLPKIAVAAGLNFNDLIEEIIRLAVKE